MVLKRSLTIFLLFALLIGCAVRKEVEDNIGLPVGRIEGNQFIGIRYPFKVSAPPGWKITTEIPKFMEKLGYEREGLEELEVFIYNPSTLSNLQIDFTPANRYSTFSQKTIEWLTTEATKDFMKEFVKRYGKNVRVKFSPTERLKLKGVPFAAKKYAIVTQTLEDGEREREWGWVYAFSEPYQIFILYTIMEIRIFAPAIEGKAINEGTWGDNIMVVSKGGFVPKFASRNIVDNQDSVELTNDREDIKKILDSFEVMVKK